MRIRPPIFKICALYPSMSLAFPFVRHLTKKSMSSKEKTSYENHIILFSFTIEKLPLEFLRIHLSKVQKLLLLSLYIVHFLPFYLRLCTYNLVKILRTRSRSIPNGFSSMLAHFIIPRVGCSIFLSTWHHENGPVNAIREGCGKFMIEVFNIVLI